MAARAGLHFIFRNNKEEAVEQACLSHRGFILMSSFDQQGFTREANESMSEIRRIDRLRHTLRQGSSEAIKKLVLHYMILSRELK